MTFQIKIQFGKSSSQNYKKAINIAKKFSEFSPISEGNEVNRIVIEKDELLRKFRFIESLLIIISSWNSTEF